MPSVAGRVASPRISADAHPLSTTPRVYALLIAMVAIDGLLALAHLGTRTLDGLPWIVQHQFDLDAEASLTTFYASAKWLLCAAAITVGLALPSARDGMAERRLRFLLGLFFVALACDEVAQVHEWFGTVLDRYVIERRATALPVTHFWMLVPVLFVSLVGLMSWRTLRRGSMLGGQLFLGGIALLLLGAAGVELLANFTGDSRWLQTMQVLTEETLENAGASVALAGMLRYNADRGVGLTRAGTGVR